MISATVVIPVMLASSRMYQTITSVFSSPLSLRHIKLNSIVVVNNSQAVADEVAKMCEKSRMPVNVICQGKNTGFAAATNAGIRASSSEFVLTFNDDAWVEPEFIHEILETQKKSGADMVASTIYRGDTNEIDSCGIDFAWRGKAWPLKPVEKGWQSQDQPELGSPLQQFADNWLKQPDLLPKLTSPDDFHQPFGPDAAAALYSRKMLEKIGLFNESYFAYLEDVDLALRARLAGYRCAWAPKAVVHHQKHATSNTMGKFKQKQDVKNWWRMVSGTYPKKVWSLFGPQIALERMRNLKGLF